MKHQLVSVDYWAMLKSMVLYGVLTVLGWMMLRLFNAVFSLPRRLRTQQANIQATLEEFQRRYPDLNVTEEDIKNADKELAEWTREMDENRNKDTKDGPNETENKTVKERCETPPAIEEEECETPTAIEEERCETPPAIEQERCETPSAIEEDKKTI